jgi:hypothetical protein
MSIRQLAISEFADNCVAEIDALKGTKAILELVRDGQVIGFLCPPPSLNGQTDTLADWMGTGAGFAMAEGTTLDKPTFSTEEWETAPGDD